MDRPDRSEYAEFYHGYVRLVPDGDIVRTLQGQIVATRAIFERVPPEGETRAYAPGKWTVREVLGHVIDAERVFAHRGLWFSRDPDTPLPSMEQDVWVANSNAGSRALADLIAEWATVREATLALIRGLDAQALSRVGTASGVHFTVRSIPWIIAGHELHHRDVLRDRYALS